jgi:hypothetical protein
MLCIDKNDESLETYKKQLLGKFLTYKRQHKIIRISGGLSSRSINCICINCCPR